MLARQMPLFIIGIATQRDFNWHFLKLAVSLSGAVVLVNSYWRLSVEYAKRLRH